ncbi:hypothetical protein [Pseudomonas putida]|uniref:Uncharacterized protein n=1 Tax=Pseudomonas putida TaxID=303 RepID=A0A8I1EAT0_PSEPU|nr:hypothetical protein [Pseudomonas putida]MBI6882320.1 hypothetical protein [Pseudomonas putida]
MNLKIIVKTDLGEIYLKGNENSVNIIFDYRFDRLVSNGDVDWIGNSAWKYHVNVVKSFSNNDRIMKFNMGVFSCCSIPSGYPSPFQLSEFWVDRLIDRDWSYEEFPKNSLKYFSSGGAKIGGFYKNIRVNNELISLSGRIDTVCKQIDRSRKEFGGVVIKYTPRNMAWTRTEDGDEYIKLLKENEITINSNNMCVSYRVFKSSLGIRNFITKKVMDKYYLEDMVYGSCDGRLKYIKDKPGSRKSVFLYRGNALSINIPRFMVGPYDLRLVDVLESDRDIINNLMLIDDRQGGLEYLLKTLKSDVDINNFSEHSLFSDYLIKLISSSQSHLDTSAMCIIEGRENIKSVIESVFSIELSLKFYILMVDGAPEIELKNDYGHDVRSLFKKARKHGLICDNIPSSLSLNNMTSNRYDFVSASISEQWIYHRFAQGLLSDVVEHAVKILNDSGRTSQLKCYAEAFTYFECEDFSNTDVLRPKEGFSLI